MTVLSVENDVSNTLLVSIQPSYCPIKDNLSDPLEIHDNSFYDNSLYAVESTSSFYLHGADQKFSPPIIPAKMSRAGRI